MPLETLQFPPGINTEFTRTLNMAGWSRSNRIRWKMGMPEKLGGWQHVNTELLTGTPRGIHAWADLNGISYIGVGTNSSLEVLTGGQLYDITPTRQTDNIIPNFSTISGSNIVTVTDPSINVSVGDRLIVLVPVSIGGLIIQGYYTVESVPGAGSYTITAAENATDTVTNGGVVPLFSVTNGDPSITVMLPNHGLSAGQLFPIQVPTNVGGILLQGSYPVLDPITTDTFVIAPGPSAVVLDVISATMATPGNGYQVGNSLTMPTGVSVIESAVLAVSSTFASVSNAFPDSGGSNYAVGDTVTMPTGTGITTPAVLVVTVTGDGGSVVALGIRDAGSYTETPTNPVVPASTSGSGTGLAVDFNYVLGQIETVIVARPGLYNAFPANPVTPAHQTGTGTGATFNLEMGTTSESISENNGNARIEYLIAAGPTSNTLGSGYGAGLYGAGLYGAGDGRQVTVPLRQWFLDNWGQDLIGNYTGSTLYYWEPPVGTDNIAQAITGTDVPMQINSSFVAEPEQIVVALGCNPPLEEDFDPLEIRWCDVANFGDWIATATNQAGSYRLPTGSRIVGGLQGPQWGCIWTDVDFWLMQYLGAPLVFGFNKVRTGQGLLAARGAAVYATMVYSVSKNNFFVFDGNTTNPIPCPVWDQFFKNINLEQVDKVVCGVNSLFGEIWWFYPSAASDEVDSYVKYSVNESQLAGVPVWDYGQMVRLCWQDVNPYGNPLGCDNSGYIQQHEIGTDADGAPMGESIQSGYAAIAHGDVFLSIGRFLPNFKWQEGISNQKVNVTISTIDYPESDVPPIVLGPYTCIQKTTAYFTTQGARGRGVAVALGSSPEGTFWRLGALRYLAKSTGRR